MKASYKVSDKLQFEVEGEGQKKSLRNFLPFKKYLENQNAVYVKIPT